MLELLRVIFSYAFPFQNHRLMAVYRPMYLIFIAARDLIVTGWIKSFLLRYFQLHWFQIEY